MSELETLFLVDGGFGPWSDWGDCSKPCNFDGTANQKRTRQCDSPPPSNNGADCIGEKEELKRCQLPIAKEGTIIIKYLKSAHLLSFISNAVHW